MFKNKLFAGIASSCLLAGMLLSGCGEKIPEISDADINSLVADNEILNVTINHGDIQKLSGSEYGSQYTAFEKVTVSYKPDDLSGMLPQKVTKEMTFCYDGENGAWDYIGEALTSCEADSTKLPGTSWVCTSLSEEDISALFGDEVPSGDTGSLYFRFMKKMGLFAFNLTNENNTPSERYFGTVGTALKAVWTGASGNIEKNINIYEGSVTNAGDLYLVLETEHGSAKINLKTDAVQVTELEYDEAVGKEVDRSKVYMDSLPVFTVTTTSIENGEWKQSCGLKEGNLSPELSWEPVEGAAKYAVIMLDTTTTNWLSWYVITDKTHLDEGEYTDQSVYVGPYPAETHTYELYVVALKDDPQDLSFRIDDTGGDIHQKLDFLNTAADGSTGNVIAYGNITAPYTSPELYYGYR